jgi:catechol 2,3-dioxygenase-like lactoylglutathione lyase family enzyme
MTRLNPIPIPFPIPTRPGSGSGSGAPAVVVLLASLMILPALADDNSAPRGFQEVVFSVSDLEAATAFYQEAAGWRVIHRGRAGAEQARFWGLAAEQTVDEVLLGNPGVASGFLRLVSFTGAGGGEIRPAAQPWDTGGIFDVNVRVLDIHTKVAQLKRLGWQFYSDPVRFEFGPFVVWEVLARGPDGIVVAMIERVEPPLEGWPNLRQMSRIFNSTQVVRDFERSREFFESTLGFKVYLEHEGASPEPGPNVFGLPHNLAAEVARHIVILSPDGGNEGSVELISFEGLPGADFSARAAPPNLGILALRFPVSDLGALQRRLASRDVAPAAGPQTVEVEPYGPVEMMAVRAPEGAWLEFYEAAADQEQTTDGKE